MFPFIITQKLFFLAETKAAQFLSHLSIEHKHEIAHVELVAFI